MRRLCILALLLLPTRILSAQSRDLTGTWVLDLAKSSFGNSPAPTADSMVITRSGTMYHVDETTTSMEGPTQHMTWDLPAADGEVTNNNPPQNGQPASSIHMIVTMRGDTMTTTAEITVAGQRVARQSSREYLTPEKKSYVRDVNLQMAIGGGAPVHFIAVYDKK